MAILAKHGLNPNDFDIPGRIKGRSGNVIIDDPLAFVFSRANFVCLRDLLEGIEGRVGRA